jgi:hypothetical protein
MIDWLIIADDLTGAADPEIVMRSLAHEDVYAWCRPLVVGDAQRLRQAGAMVQSKLALRAVPARTWFGKVAISPREGEDVD